MSTDPGALEAVPASWRDHPMLLGDRARWSSLDAVGDDDGVLLTVVRQGTRTLLGLGDPRRVDELLAEVVARPLQPVGWMSLPHGTEADERVLGALGLAPFSTWDWLLTREPPRTGAGPDVPVERLGAAAGEEIAACLAEANPGSSAGASDASPPGWWGVREAGRLGAVGGAGLRGGAPSGHGRSWHVHGLGVLPALRGRGLGRAIAAALTRDAFAEGVDWVSLGVYADNDTARRLYASLGFEVGAQFRSFGPVGAGRPPS